MTSLLVLVALGFTVGYGWGWLSAEASDNLRQRLLRWMLTVLHRIRT